MTTQHTGGGLAQTVPYVLETPEAVEALLTRYPFLASLLIEALPPLEASFGTDTPCVVAVESDPEIPGWEDLVVRIVTPLAVEDAATRLDTVETTWWLDQLPRAQGKLCFTLEFV